MHFIKKYWYLILLALFTAGLGVIVYLTSQQLATTEQVAPTTPEAEAEAAAPACKLAFNLTTTTTTGTPTPSPTPTVTSTPTPTPTATPTPTPTATPTPQPLSSCNGTCTTNEDCRSGLACVDNSCRNPSCTGETSCKCQIVYVNATPTPTPIVAPAPPASCNNACTLNTDCSGGLVCVDGACRNASCTDKASCTCELAAAQPTPKVPVSGSGPSVLGASIIAGGLLILLLGLAL